MKSPNHPKHLPEPEHLDTSEAEQYWAQPFEDLLAALHSTPDGLSTADAKQRLEQFGPNLLDPKQKPSAFLLFLRQFKSPIILILLFATGVSAVLRDWVDALIILTIVLGSALLTFVQEYSAGNAVEKLRSQITAKATVLRDGQPQSIPAEEVVPGDVVLLSAGSLVPADGVLLQARDFFVNQAVLTGETFPVEKEPGTSALQASLSERTNCVFRGTNVRSGTARSLAVQTGTATVYGQIAKRLVLRAPETGFERGIRQLGYLLTETMLMLVLAIFAINVFFHKPFLDSLLFSVALAVGLTPQLLPAIISINLSQGSQSMAAAGVIVRRLACIENLGSMDILCTDKTGTLTEGAMQLHAALDDQGQPSDRVFCYAYLNAHFQMGLANPLDQAIIAVTPPDVQGYDKIDEIPYDFVRKRLSVVVKEDGQYLLITKGALENVLAVCTQVQEGTTAAPLDPVRRSKIQGRYAEWSTQGFRVLGIALKSVPLRPTYTRADECDLSFVGFLLFFDPPKSGVQTVVSDLEALGVRLKIVTGDNKLVSLYTAKAVGLEVTGVLTGAELHELRDEALWQAAERVTIFSEVDPNQKERIIAALQKMGHVVGYLGDGINDAPALHDADVGISVDQAVDVAKEAADLVLLQRDLAVLHRGIVEGRKTFANTLKYIFMATSANFGNMLSMAATSLFLSFLPMLPKQILLINFLTDFPEMTIASDNVDQTYLREPRRWDIAFIRRFMLIFSPLSSVFDFLTFAVLLWLVHATPELFRTGWFVESVLSASLVVFALRTQLPLTRSRPSRAMVAATAMVGLVTLILPFSPIASLLGFSALPLFYLVVIGAIVVVYLLCAELTKRLLYRV